MAEKPKPPKQLTLDLEGKEEKPKQKKSTSSHKVVLDASTPSKKTSTPRKKPTVTTRSMTVKIPSDKQPVVKPETKVPPAKKKPTPRTADQPNPHVVQTRTRKHPATKTSKPKKQQVVPPKIGKRTSYRPPLSKRLLLPLLIALLVCTVLIILYAHFERPSILDRSPSVIEERDVVALTIESGMTARTVSLLLEQLGVVEDAQTFLAYLVDEELATVIQTGTYIMGRNLEFREVASMLANTEKTMDVTIPPGFTILEIDGYLASRLGGEAGLFIEAVNDLVSAYQLSFAEGWLLSGPYTVHRNRAGEELALAMYQKMLRELQGLLDSPLLERYSIEELLIVASMIQAETQDVTQMEGISSVIHNRLKNGEPLGIDATTRYEIGDWENPIPIEALETKSPYNTRRKAGLPPSGICSPGVDALEAAFFPKDSPYFYYLHGYDKEIHYAETYEEHKQNISLYR
ncbi:endolytic transglycosylase MltG [uncultured Sphaerochaeta sp.]|uniref:endolytic transglycosylase MltG n=1 Tax=uncultured Sphaerochaeta sp. TaxID=886478 RepID=UPI0029CA64FF|nr:endolytic transglycosylase MltG [uncultured Sphaerochaeta sp.]